MPDFSYRLLGFVWLVGRPATVVLALATALVASVVTFDVSHNGWFAAGAFVAAGTLTALIGESAVQRARRLQRKTRQRETKKT